MTTRQKFTRPTAVFLAAALLATQGLSGCTERGEPDGRTLGMVVGATIGLVLGSKIGSGTGKTLGTALGAVAGGWLGGEFGARLTQKDRAYLEETTRDTLEYGRTGETKKWHNPDSGHSGTVTPVRTYETASATPCRTFETAVLIDGASEVATGEACRQPDGSWKIVR